jgi:hypothetical protein
VCGGHGQSIDAGKVAGEGLPYPALALGLLLELIQMLGEEIPDGVRRLELQWQYAVRYKDAQEHLDPPLDLLQPAEASCMSAPDTPVDQVRCDCFVTQNVTNETAV